MVPRKCPRCGSRAQWEQAEIYTPEKTSTELARLSLGLGSGLLNHLLRRHFGTRDVPYRCYNCGYEMRFHK